VRFVPTPLAGAFLLEPERREDDRGFFARTWCDEEADAAGIAVRWVQCNVSFNRRAGTLRGLHFQAAPHAEAKLVRCTAGAIHDVIVDLRHGSATFGRWFAAELTAANQRALFVPEGFAHGFQTLADDSEVFYQMSAAYRAGAGRGLRWDDPELAIRWPHAQTRTVSARDQSWPHLADVALHGEFRRVG